MKITADALELKEMVLDIITTPEAPSNEQIIDLLKLYTKVIFSDEYLEKE